MQPALFDLPDNPDQPDTPPTLLTNWSPTFPAELRKTTEPSYAIIDLTLDEKGERTSIDIPFLHNESANYDKSIGAGAMTKLQFAPALKNGAPVKSFSWIGVIYNPPSASKDNVNATPRILKVAPILYKRKQLAGFYEISLFFPVTIKIDAAGIAKNLKFKTNTTFTRAMRPNIERSLTQWQFAPARKNGQPVDATLTFILRLDQDPIDAEQEQKRQADETPLKMPELIERVNPIYPSGLGGMGGMVTVTFIVDTKGKVHSPEVVYSTNDYFEKAALEAVRLWRFKPAIGKDGKPMEVHMRIPIQFTPR